MTTGLGDDFQPAFDRPLHSPACGISLECGGGGDLFDTANRVPYINQARKEPMRHVRKCAELPPRSVAEALDASSRVSSHRIPCPGWRSRAPEHRPIR